ncbi:MAG: twin-arginine translocase subunit TatB [Rhodanobacteraceae bacterium]|nr:MAG: twin-arginine translocase subunit TatB [Rhodanobacteraceae bacterium]
MIDLDVSKLLLVALIALIVLGPEKLPKATRMAGAMLRRVRGGWNSVRAEVEHELELEELRESARRFELETARIGQAAKEQVDAFRQVADGVADDARRVTAVAPDPSAAGHAEHADH